MNAVWLRLVAAVRAALAHQRAEIARHRAEIAALKLKNKALGAHINLLKAQTRRLRLDNDWKSFETGLCAERLAVAGREIHSIEKYRGWPMPTSVPSDLDAEVAAAEAAFATASARHAEAAALALALGQRPSNA